MCQYLEKLYMLRFTKIGITWLNNGERREQVGFLKEAKVRGIPLHMKKTNNNKKKKKKKNTKLVRKIRCELSSTGL